ncbi:hypothetical protein GYMLUDRAFT_35780 [Collybiopsis luxurians FD-317 M1]|nr:hypothetical protein GYMLUDRAFT_35780 [Collybiopsis luxurians FD-317 M1]
MITRYSSILSLIFFILSIALVIHPLSFSVPLPRVGKRKISLNLTTAPIIAIAILWVAQCLGPTQIRDGIIGTDGVKPYNILILFFSLAYCAITLDITGVLQSAAFYVSNKGGSNGWKLYLYFYLMLTLLSMVLGNDPVILSGTAFLVYYTNATRLEPLPWLISEFAAANTASMVLFVGNPTNVVICEGFAINNAAFTAYTILPFLACNLACFLALAVQFRRGHIPRNLLVTEQVNPWSVLLDPFGAIVGSVLLGSCLVVIIIVSFFKIDVWMISLPFAVAKFIFDLVWDHYRFVHNKLPPRKIGDEHRPNPDLTTSTETRNSVPSSLQLADVEANADAVIASAKSISTPTLTPTSRSDSEFELFPSLRSVVRERYTKLSVHFPTLFTALPRLPFGLVPFAFSQFILIEALQHQGWIDVFAQWLSKASQGKIYPSVWLVGTIGVIMCNIAGTNIGATILLTKVVRAAPGFDERSTRAAGIALGVASNIGAVSFTFSASLAGLLWQTILKQKDIRISQKSFALWNLLPILVMTSVGLAVISAEMAVLY